MPELPDLTVYSEAIETHFGGDVLELVRLKSPFLLRTAAPPITDVFGKTLRRVTRIGKRLVFEMDGELFLLVHLMVAGRFQWKKKNSGIPGKIGLAAMDFSSGTLLLTEASSKKRASLHLVQRIVYSENECNYCPNCQTGGKILADRSLSRILKGDWPRSLDELEELMNRHASVQRE